MIINIPVKIGFGASANKYKIAPLSTSIAFKLFSVEKIMETVAAVRDDINETPHKKDLSDIEILLRIIVTINPIIKEMMDIIITTLMLQIKDAYEQPSRSDRRE